MDEAAEDLARKDKEKDKAQDRWQGSTWGSLFGAAGQGGRSGGMSPTRNSEVKKAIRAAMAFGLPKRGGGGEGLPAGGVSSGKGEGVGIDGSGIEAEKGNAHGTRKWRTRGAKCVVFDLSALVSVGARYGVGPA